MATIKSYTSIEQSKKLAEILPIESADMCYLSKDNRGIEFFEEAVVSDGTREDNDIPCWSLAALMNLLPSEFTEKGEYSETTYKIDIRKYALTDDVDIYQIAYGNYKFYEDGNRSWKDMINTGEKEDLLDVCVEMIIKLSELKKL